MAVPDAITHLRKPTILTATTEDLQAFYVSHVETPGAFTEADTVFRLDPAETRRIVGRFILEPERRPWPGALPPPPPPPGVEVDEDGDDEQEVDQRPVPPCSL